MKPRQLLKFILKLFILGTVFTLAMSVFYVTYEFQDRVDPVTYAYRSTTDFGVPMPWFSHTTGWKEGFYWNWWYGTIFKRVIISEYDFLMSGFIEDVLLYTSIVFLIPLFDYLIKLILHWRYGKSLNLQRNLVLPQD
jgi:hypothetical protein